MRGASPRRGNQCPKSLKRRSPFSHKLLAAAASFAAGPLSMLYTGFPAASLTDNLDTYDIDSEIGRGVFAQLTWSG